MLKDQLPKANYQSNLEDAEDSEEIASIKEVSEDLGSPRQLKEVSVKKQRARIMSAVYKRPPLSSKQS